MNKSRVPPSECKLFIIFSLLSARKYTKDTKHISLVFQSDGSLLMFDSLIKFCMIYCPLLHSIETIWWMVVQPLVKWDSENTSVSCLCNILFFCGTCSLQGFLALFTIYLLIFFTGNLYGFLYINWRNETVGNEIGICLANWFDLDFINVWLHQKQCLLFENGIFSYNKELNTQRRIIKFTLISWIKIRKPVTQTYFRNT